MRLSRRKNQMPFGWLSAVFFNILFLITAIVLSLLIYQTRIALGDEFEPTREALAATDEKLGALFADMVPVDADRREFWAAQIDAEIRVDDLISARAFLLAAPDMLNERDAAAVTAAATTDTTGPLDQRMLNAAKLFLPDDVRARYERATGLPDYNPVSSLSEQLRSAPDSEPAVPDEAASQDSAPTEESSTDVNSSAERTSSDSADFYVLGNARDLSFQSAGWVRGDPVDVFALSLSGLGLVARDGLLEGFNPDTGFYEGASLLKAAIRANRLQPEFEALLRTRLENALPPDVLRENLARAFRENSNILIQSDAIFDAFARSTDASELDLIASDLDRIAELSRRRSTVSALTLLGTVTSLRDLKRAELVSMAGGDRAVTLAKHRGDDVLNAAVTIMDWSMKLITLIVIFGVLCLILGWIAVGTLLRSLRYSRY